MRPARIDVAAWRPQPAAASLGNRRLSARARALCLEARPPPPGPRLFRAVFWSWRGRSQRGPLRCFDRISSISRRTGIARTDRCGERAGRGPQPGRSRNEPPVVDPSAAIVPLRAAWRVADFLPASRGAGPATTGQLLRPAREARAAGSASARSNGESAGSPLARSARRPGCRGLDQPHRLAVPGRRAVPPEVLASQQHRGGGGGTLTASGSGRIFRSSFSTACQLASRRPLGAW